MIRKDGFDCFLSLHQAEDGAAPLPVPYRNDVAPVRSNNCHCYVPRDLRDDTEAGSEAGGSQTIRLGSACWYDVGIIL